MTNTSTSSQSELQRAVQVAKDTPNRNIWNNPLHTIPNTFVQKGNITGIENFGNFFSMGTNHITQCIPVHVQRFDVLLNNIDGNPGGLHDGSGRLLKCVELCPHQNLPNTPKYWIKITDKKQRSLPILVGQSRESMEVFDEQQPQYLCGPVKNTMGYIPSETFKQKIKERISNTFAHYCNCRKPVRWLEDSDASSPVDTRDAFVLVDQEQPNIMVKVAFPGGYRNILNNRNNEYYLAKLRRSFGSDWQFDITKMKSRNTQSVETFTEISAKERSDNYFNIKPYDRRGEEHFQAAFNKSFHNHPENKITVFIAIIRGERLSDHAIETDGPSEIAAGGFDEPDSLDIKRGIAVTSDQGSGTRLRTATVASDMFTIIGLQQIDIYPYTTKSEDNLTCSHVLDKLTKEYENIIQPL